MKTTREKYNLYARAWYRRNPRGVTRRFKRCQFCGGLFQYRVSSLKFCSRSCGAKGRLNHAQVTKRCLKCGDTFQVKRSHALRRKCCSKSCASSIRRGNLSPNWRGGSTDARRLAMSRKEYKNWRITVFSRDGFKCVFCGDDRGGNLEADHIKPVFLYPELTYDLSNGRTLCHSCHKQTSTYGKKVMKLSRVPEKV